MVNIGALDMSVEELLESVQTDLPKTDPEPVVKQDHDRSRNDDRPRSSRTATAERDDGKDGDDKASANGSVRSRRRHSPDYSHRDARDPTNRRGSDAHRNGGDYYRGGARPRSRSPGRLRSRSPAGDDRHYRPSNGGRHDRDDRSRRDGDRHSTRDRSPRRDRDRDYNRGPRGSQARARTPEPTDDERDRRTVFVQQLAARLRTRDLESFFSKVGPVKEAQIVKDRVSGRSKGYLFHTSIPQHALSTNCFL